MEAAKSIKKGKAPGLDGMTPDILRTMVECRPDRYAALINGILKRGKIPDPWKKARMILLRKQGKGPSIPSVYRPICVIDAVSKLLEYVLRARILTELGDEPFETAQYGFAKGKTTLHAMDQLRRTAVEVTSRRKYAAAVALDVKKAFNTLSWKEILDEMVKRNLSQRGKLSRIRHQSRPGNEERGPPRLGTWTTVLELGVR